MKRFVLVIALTGLMSVTALAGEIPTNGAAATPTPQTSTATTTSSTASTSSILLVTVILTVLGLR